MPAASYAHSLLDPSHSPLVGNPLFVINVAECVLESPDGGILIAVDYQGALPELDHARFDALVTTHPSPPQPWVSVSPTRIAAQLAAVKQTVARVPIAASLLTRILRIGENLPFDDALALESLAYSTLLGGQEFARWLAGRRATSSSEEHLSARVDYLRSGDEVTLVLNSPANHNAMTAAMRDLLYERLANVVEDPSTPRLILRAAGRCFSTGGFLPEFGTAQDLAVAHAVRCERNNARLLHRLGSRAEVHLHGACIGSGIEVPAAAARRVGKPNTFMQLPELRMGLVPGAGGTVTIARAIGRHRLLWLALSGCKLGARQAQDWGLLHEVRP
jgi:Enoyl-CoA hydratase/isomerase